MKILSCLAYFDIFNYPLNIDDLVRYTGEDKQIISGQINELESKALVFNCEGYYSIRPDSGLVEKRKAGNIRAKQYRIKAEKKAKLISKFPYVSGVYISGSLSKNFMGEDGDVDYFIVTKPNRLWVARTLLIAYKKVFLLNSRKYFCVNYFVDEKSLEINEKNRFTATELVTLIPMSNTEQYSQLINSNSWVNQYYPLPENHKLDKKVARRSWFQKLTEPILNTKIGDKLDAYFLKITLKKWNKKFGTMSPVDFQLALKSSKRVSKHHPSNYQKKVLQEFEDRMTVLNTKLKTKV